MIKKLLLTTAFFASIFFLATKLVRQSFAQVVCAIYEDSPPQGEDKDPSLLELDPVTYDPKNPYVHFGHETDPNAPQLTTLIEGVTSPEIKGVYLIRGSDIPSDAPSGFGNFVGFNAGNNNITVPRSGYSIGQGLEVTVIHADENSVVVKYTAENNIVYGYTVYLEGITVDPAVLQAYQQAGDGEVAALPPGTILGIATNGNIMVGIRDTGMWMDPRWIEDWWSITDFPPIEQGEIVCWDPTINPRADTCPNIKEGYVVSCGQGFIVKIPALFINFVGEIARHIFPDKENMPSWIRGGGSYERKNPIPRLSLPGEDLTNVMESGWRESLTAYDWCNLNTGECGVTEGDPDLPETSNNAFYYGYESANYLWQLFRSPSMVVLGQNTTPNRPLSFNEVDYPITLTQTEGDEECGIAAVDIASTSNSVSFVVQTTGAVNQFRDLWYEVSGPKGKTNCSTVLPKAGNTNPRVICENLAYEDGSSLNAGDIINIIATSPQSWEECEITEAREQIALGESKPGGGGPGGGGMPSCAVFGASGAPQAQPCVAGNCLLPENIVSRVFQEFFNKLGELVEKTPIGWITSAHDVLFVPRLYYPSSVMSYFERAAGRNGLYNFFLPPDQANPTPYPAIAEDNIHKIDLGPFNGKIGSTRQSDHMIPAAGRVKIQSDLFKEFLEPPNQAL